MATSFAQCKTAADRGKKASRCLLVLCAYVLFLRGLMSTPAPFALEGRLAPILVATPRHSLQTSVCGDLQTGRTRLGVEQRKSSLRLATQHVHCKVPCNVQPLIARSPHTSRTMRRTTPRTTLRRCSTRTAAPMRRNVSSSLNHSQQHNRSLVPARVPLPRLFGQVVSMRNHQLARSAAQFQSQRANARHRPTFQHTN